MVDVGPGAQELSGVFDAASVKDAEGVFGSVEVDGSGRLGGQNVGEGFGSCVEGIRLARVQVQRADDLAVEDDGRRQGGLDAGFDRQGGEVGEAIVACKNVHSNAPSGVAR
jgi:hypothetical protein